MELRATRCEIVPEDDEFLAHAFFQDERSYFSLRRLTSRSPCDSRQIESERDDQSWATREDPESCELRNQSFRVKFGAKGAAELGGTSSVTISFPAEHIVTLRRTLAEIFRDRTF